MIANILIVDDEPCILNSIKRMFLEDNYTIFTALSPYEGLSILEKEDIQVVVSDFRLPEMSGVDFLHIVAQKWPTVVTIILSGYSDASVIKAIINESGIYKFVEKPWNDTELRLSIANAVKLSNIKRSKAQHKLEGKKIIEECPFMSKVHIRTQYKP